MLSSRVMTRVLVLGGTGDARRLAALAGAAGLEVVSSLAGRTRAPLLPEGDVRVGGFGGVEGLAAYLRDERIDLLVDATHPFADVISAHAAEAATRAGVPRARLDRPVWREVPGDRWTHLASMEAAAEALPALGRRAFLAIGRQELAAFAGLEGVWCLARMIEPPEDDAAGPAAGQVLYDRGPFTEDGERALMRAHDIDVLVTRNSGGDDTAAKLAAARALGVPVVMVARPPAVEGDTVATPEAALEWLLARRDVARSAGPGDRAGLGFAS